MMALGIGLVAQEGHRLVRVRDGEIHPTVIVEIGLHRAAGNVSRSKIRAALPSDVLELAILVTRQNGNLPRGDVFGTRVAWPVSRKRSSLPWWSMSKKPVPQPTVCRPNTARPAAAV